MYGNCGYGGFRRVVQVLEWVEWVRVMVVMVWMEHDVQVLEWVALLQEAWDLSSSTVASLPCQKRAVCEIWR